MASDTVNNNYAYEIRFVDNNVVQVFDLAAKRKQEATSKAILPLEYKEDEVVKGQLRYSKLVGSVPSTANKDIFGYEDTDKPYEHRTVTKISKNRRSTQRNTMFMMGGGGSDRKRYDSGTDFSNVEEEEPADEYYYYQQTEEEDAFSAVDEQEDSDHQNDMVSPSYPINVSGPAPSKQLISAAATIQAADSGPQYDENNIPPTMANQNNVISTLQPKNTPITTSSYQSAAINAPQQAFIPSHYETYKHSQHFSIENHDSSSEKYMQQSMISSATTNKKSRDCCCIIS